MWKYYGICSLLCIIINVVHGHGPRSFDDTVFYTINWPGVNRDILESRHHGEPYIITTANKEMYLCLIINNTAEPEQDYKGPYRGVGPMELLTPLFEQTSCVYKVESYWSYELCHGQYVRQYHEGRDGKKVKIQEYYLGRFSNEQLRKLFMEYTKRAASPTKRADIPVKKLNGVAMPYVEVEMTDGSYCELTNKQRKVKVLYVCYPHSIHEYFKIEEPSSCEYEIVVLTSVLCYHPDYKPRVAGQNEINCYPVDNAPKKPKALTAMEMESLKLRNQKVTDDKLQKAYAIFHVDKEGQDSEVPGRVEIHPVGVIDKHNNIEDSINSLADQGISPADISPVKNFLSGNNCLHGGNGWWKYEFCYGRSVVQYHIERDGKKTIVNLGTFDKQKHLEWIAAHPHKRPKSPELRKPLSHFYSDGTVCDKTGNRRQTEVKLKCVESETGSPSSVSLFLLEPKTCEYVLGVESPLICAILEYADENGLLSEKFEVNFDKLKTTAFHEYDDLDERIANGDD